MTVFKKILFALIPASVFLVVLNAACGMIAKDRYVRMDMVTGDLKDRTYGYFAPNQSRTLVFPGLAPYKVTIDEMGLRTTGSARSAAERLAASKKILCVGDSMTFGLFLNDEDTYPHKLQKLFDKKNADVAVFNAGIGSTTIKDHLYYIKEKGLSLKPDVVIINFFDNDLVELKRQEPYYQEILGWKTPGFSRAFKRTKLMRAFLKFKVDYKYKRWMSKIKDARVKDILVNEKKDLEDILYVSEHHHVKDPVLNPHNESLKELWQQYFALLEETAQLLKQSNARLIFLIHPEILVVFDRVKDSHEDVLRGFLRGKAIEHIDMTAELKKHKDNAASYYNDLPRDNHLGARGNQLLAEKIFERLDGL